MRGSEVRERAGARPRGERRSDEHRAPFGARAHILVQQRPEEEDDVRVRPEHATRCQRCHRHTRKPRDGPVWTVRGVDVALKRHERVRGDLELRGQHARRELSC